jgi:hypothetical protein
LSSVGRNDIVPAFPATAAPDADAPSPRPGDLPRFPAPGRRRPDRRFRDRRPLPAGQLRPCGGRTRRRPGLQFVRREVRRRRLALDYSLRPLFTYLRADVVTTSVFAATDDWAQAGGENHDGDGSSLPQRIERAGRSLAALVFARGDHAKPADPFASTPSFLDMLGEQGSN